MKIFTREDKVATIADFAFLPEELKASIDKLCKLGDDEFAEQENFYTGRITNSECERLSKVVVLLKQAIEAVDGALAALQAKP